MFCFKWIIFSFTFLWIGFFVVEFSRGDIFNGICHTFLAVVYVGIFCWYIHLDEIMKKDQLELEKLQRELAELERQIELLKKGPIL